MVFRTLVKLPRLHKQDHQGVGVPGLLLGYHAFNKRKWPLKGSYNFFNPPRTQSKTTYGYLNTLQGFWQCPKGSKGSKGFKLGLGQGQKVSFDIYTYSTLKGTSRDTKTHRHTSIGINDNLVNNLPLCHWWQLQSSPLERASFVHKSPPFSSLPLPSLFKFFSPFRINGKGHSL